MERIIPISIEAIDKTTNSKIIEERETANKICEKDGHYYLKVSLFAIFYGENFHLGVPFMIHSTVVIIIIISFFAIRIVHRS